MAKFSMVYLSLFMVVCFGIVAHGQPYDATAWTDAKASCIGDNISPGLLGDACGYGNPYACGYGSATASLSSELFNSGKICGACFQIVCKADQSKLCYPDKRVVVTSTSFCPETSGSDHLCAAPKLHFAMGWAAYGNIAPPNYDSTIIPIQFRRIPCVKSGGVRFTIYGSFWKYFIKVFNIAGPGNANIVAIKGDKLNTEFINMDLSFGQIFMQSANLMGQKLSFKVTAGDDKYGNILTFWEISDAGWKFGQTFESLYNFQ